MNFESVMRLIGRWSGTLKFFPSDPEARIGIAQEISEMASNEEQVRWLVSRLPKLYTDWPAMHEVRAAFCSKFRAKDGIEVYSHVYPDGVPAEINNRNYLPAGEVRQLSPAMEPEMAAIVVSLKRAAIIPPAKATEPPAGANDLDGLLRDIDIHKAEERRKEEYRATEVEMELVKRRQRENLIAKWGTCQACFLPHDPGVRCFVGDVA